MDIDDICLRCPITLNILYDPVVIQDGTTYEREAIAKHFETKLTSPLTGKTLGTPEMFPNRFMREVIIKHLEKNLDEIEDVYMPQLLSKNNELNLFLKNEIIKNRIFKYIYIFPELLKYVEEDERVELFNKYSEKFTEKNLNYIFKEESLININKISVIKNINLWKYCNVDQLIELIFNNFHNQNKFREYAYQWGWKRF